MLVNKDNICSELRGRFSCLRDYTLFGISRVSLLLGISAEEIKKVLIKDRKQLKSLGLTSIKEDSWEVYPLVDNKEKKQLFTILCIAYLSIRLKVPLINIYE